jgi:hypothetical protein
VLVTSRVTVWTLSKKAEVSAFCGGSEFRAVLPVAPKDNCIFKLSIVVQSGLIFVVSPGYVASSWGASKAWFAGFGMGRYMKYAVFQLPRVSAEVKGTVRFHTYPRPSHAAWMIPADSVDWVSTSGPPNFPQQPHSQSLWLMFSHNF